MEFAPRQTILVKDLNIALEGYARRQQLHPENWIEYRSKEYGILITALLAPKGDTVAVIAYGPTDKQEELLLCRAQSNY
jgi:hypothetical protein